MPSRVAPGPLQRTAPPPRLSWSGCGRRRPRRRCRVLGVRPGAAIEMRRRISLSLRPEDRCGSRPAATGADRRGATGGPESQRVRPVVLGGRAAYGHVGAQCTRPAAAGAAVRHGQDVRADGRVGGEDRAPGAPAGTGIRRRGVGRVLTGAAGGLSDPRAIELVHFRDFILSSSNQFSTTISLSGVPVSSGRIIKKRWSSGATAYWGVKRKDVNPAAEKSAVERPSENLGVVFTATATRFPEPSR